MTTSGAKDLDETHAAIGAVIGGLVGAGQVNSSLPVLSQHGGGQALGAVGVVIGAALGAVGGFVAVVLALVAASPLGFAVVLALGVVATTIVVLFMAAYERAILRWRGYRRASIDEARRLAPLLQEIEARGDFDGRPRYVMDDAPVLGCWTHMRSLVITTGLLTVLDDDELSAVLAHEMTHWDRGDSVGLRLFCAASMPVNVLFNVGMFLAGVRGAKAQVHTGWAGLLAVIGWMVAFPSWVVIRVGRPILATKQREYEYDADSAAKAMGYGEGLISAIQKMAPFQPGRTGWEQAINASHPPAELRIERLRSYTPDVIATYQEKELGGPTRADVQRFARALFTRHQSRP